MEEEEECSLSAEDVSSAKQVVGDDELVTVYPLDILYIFSP